MPFWLTISLIVAGIAAGLLALDRLSRRMKRRARLYRRKPQGGSGIPGTLTALHQLVEPEIRHVIEDREQRTVIVDDQDGKDDGQAARPR